MRHPRAFLGKTHARKGTSMPENAVILGLLVLVSVLALSMTGTSIKGFYTSVASHFSNVFPGPDTPFNAVPDTIGSIGDPIGDTPGTRHLKVTLADGTILNLAGYPADLATAVETMGTDGTTKQYAQTIQALAEQLKAQGKIDETQYQSLMDLSNEGFSLADSQKKLALALADSGGDPTKYFHLLEAAGLEPASSTGDFGHQISDIYVSKIGASSDNLEEQPYIDLDTSVFENWGSEEIRRQLNSNEQASHLGRFVSLYTLAERTNVMQDPQIQHIVKSATQDLMYLAAASGQSYSTDQIATHARQSRDDSTNICKAGNGSAQSGISCQ